MRKLRLAGRSRSREIFGDIHLDEYRSNVSPGISCDTPLAELTTLRVGERCCWLTRIHNSRELEQGCLWAQKRNLPLFFLGEGSNVLFSDRGFPGLVIQNHIKGIERSGQDIQVGGGENLLEFIDWLIGQQLAGMERMYGIPGTVAGAVVGNAGAYGQEIADSVTEAHIWSPSGEQVVGAEDLKFRYRHSLFKERSHWFILSCRLCLRSSVTDLRRIAKEILAHRSIKYPMALRCPGSFFKNIIAADLPSEIREKIPSAFIRNGKVSAGKLLEAVGAKGARRGGAQFAHYHGNLIINRGGASSEDILTLTKEYADRVWGRFGIRLAPEIIVVDRTGVVRPTL